MFISDVQKGDTMIVDGSRTKIDKIETCPSSKGTKTHINGKDCWENFTEVRIQGK